MKILATFIRVKKETKNHYKRPYEVMMSETTGVGMEVRLVNLLHSYTMVPNLPLCSINTVPYQEMLKPFIVV